MRHIFSLLIALVATSALAQAQQKITSKLGGYSVNVPAGFGSVSEQHSPIETVVGEVTMHMKLVQSPDGDDAVMVAYCDYPQEVFDEIEDKERGVEAMFDSARDGGMRNVQRSKLISEKKVDLNGLPGRSIVFEGRYGATRTNRGTPIYARFDYYIDGVRLYQLGYITSTRANLDSKSTRSMFSSFAIISTPEVEPR